MSLPSKIILWFYNSTRKEGVWHVEGRGREGRTVSEYKEKLLYFFTLSFLLAHRKQLENMRYTAFAGFKIHHTKQHMFTCINTCAWLHVHMPRGSDHHSFPGTFIFAFENSIFQYEHLLLNHFSSTGSKVRMGLSSKSELGFKHFPSWITRGSDSVWAFQRPITDQKMLIRSHQTHGPKQY